MSNKTRSPFKKDESFILKAILNHVESLKYIDNSLKNNIYYFERTIAVNPNAYKYGASDLKKISM
jgi:hypothetical protein